MKFNKLTKRLLKVIPGGSHTYSRGADTFPSNAPAILDRGKGVYIYDLFISGPQQCCGFTFRYVL